MRKKVTMSVVIPHACLNCIVWYNAYLILRANYLTGITTLIFSLQECKIQTISRCMYSCGSNQVRNLLVPNIFQKHAHICTCSADLAAELNFTVGVL